MFTSGLQSNSLSNSLSGLAGLEKNPIISIHFTSEEHQLCSEWWGAEGLFVSIKVFQCLRRAVMFQEHKPWLGCLLFKRPFTELTVL